MPDIDTTIELIKKLHEGQTDQSGKPYFQHPMRVMHNVSTIYPEADQDILMAALLHDVIEDCGVDANYLKNSGYSDACIDMVQLVTKPADDTREYTQVIDDLIASGNHGAIIIKMADNMDNLDPERVKELHAKNPNKAQRLFNRYSESIQKLAEAAGIECPEVKTPAFFNSGPPAGGPTPEETHIN